MAEQPSQSRISIDLTVRQAEALKQALELYARILIGQVEEVCQWWGDRLTHPLVLCLKRDLTGFDINANWSIAGDEAPDQAKIAWGLHKVLANRLAHARRPGGGGSVDFEAPEQKFAGSEPLATISGSSVIGFHLKVTPVHLRIIAEALETYRRSALQDYGIVADLWREYGRTKIGLKPHGSGDLGSEKTREGTADAVRPLLDELSRQVRRSINDGDVFMVGPREEHRIAFEMEKAIRAFLAGEGRGNETLIRGDVAFTFETDEPPISVMAA